jgi:hypothetical protein
MAQLDAIHVSRDQDALSRHVIMIKLKVKVALRRIGAVGDRAALGRY